MTPDAIDEIRSAVDANFTDQKHPVFKIGSKKWNGIAKWGWYVEMFFSISSGDQASFAMTPIEYVEAWEIEPRLMAILSVIQQRIRYRMDERLDAMKRDMKRGTGHLPTRPPTQR